MKTLYECYSRLLVDNHISDIRPEYMSKFNPSDYVKAVLESGVEASMVYACDHNGNCYYPTKVGHQHNSLQGRDIFGETITALQAAGIVPSAYYTMIYHNDAWRRMPQARQVDQEGHTREGRYGFVCPNHPDTAAFHRAQIQEIAQYPIASLFLDMTFWPLVCRCEHCRAKFREQTGLEIPEKISWDDPAWVRFQRFREQSMADFAEAMTAAAHEIKPDLPVVHQFSPVLHGWRLGQSAGIAKASAYASGDFYGGKKQQRFGVKVLDSYSQNKPYEFMTSRCVTLRDHTSSKSEDEMYFHALTTLANAGAYLFIDAINPDGTLEHPFYQKLARIQKRLEPFRKCIEQHHPRLWADTGIYFSMASCIDNNWKGGSNNMTVRQNAVVDEAMNLAKLLTGMHQPYRVITDSVTDFSSLRVLFLLNDAFLGEEECARVRKFVQQGGLLVVSGLSSQYGLRGESTGDFQLADVFGVHLTGEFTGPAAYLETSDGPLFTPGMFPTVRADKDTRILSHVILPDYPANDPEQYASIHSNPPGYKTEIPAVTIHQFGNGFCLYMAPTILLTEQDSQERYLEGLFRNFLPPFLLASENLPKSLEITLLKSQIAKRALLCLVNYQEELPPIPLHDITLKLDLPCEILGITSKGKPYPFISIDKRVQLKLERLDDAVFFELETK